MGPSDGPDDGPTYTSPDAEVSPANLESFATYLDALAENWADEGETGYAKKVDNQLKGDDDWPKFGDFEAAKNLEQRYTTMHDEMTTTAGQIHSTLSTLATATRKIAENYKNANALANASVDKVEQLLDKHVDPGTGPGTNGQDGQNGENPTDDGGNNGNED